MTRRRSLGRLRAIRERGGKVILIDPRRTETARLADQHIFIRPGTDVLLLLALLHVIYAENLVKFDRLAAFTDGQEVIGTLVADFLPERIAPVTGIDAKKVRELARNSRKQKQQSAMGASVSARKSLAPPASG